MNKQGMTQLDYCRQQRDIAMKRVKKLETSLNVASFVGLMGWLLFIACVLGVMT